ncbi:response regulator transcription factor [Paraburkholderia saeva]|jgi:FixJ family two-component response regulator|uniref:Response regulator protein TmoT n=1 Tax=Paraburkholderia saeva TaxID=2777537 RepID=A0A9N8RVD8_9BURK|nr:response regulator [Paraburkholderia saeva]CAG4894119.1 Response regulator protein TmoT [Paraburkholderia saeva]
MRTAPVGIIAIVDDDAIRAATGSLIRSLGWHVCLFDSAIAFLRWPDIAQTACLISDVRMPHMSGVEMHNRLLQLGHTLPTIFITAFPTPGLNAKLKAPGVIAILEKPVDAAAMEDCIARVMGTP